MLNRAGKRQHDETEKDHAEGMGKLLCKRPLFFTLENLDIFEEDLHTSLIHVFRKICLVTKKNLAGDVIAIDVS